MYSIELNNGGTIIFKQEGVALAFLNLFDEGWELTEADGDVQDALPKLIGEFPHQVDSRDITSKLRLLGWDKVLDSLMNCVVDWSL